MRKGAKERPWTLSEIKFLEENAGKIPIREIQLHLYRSQSSVKHMASRLGLSLRVYKWSLEWCIECASWRTYISPKTGRCKVCALKASTERTEVKASEVLSQMPSDKREIFERTESLRGRRKPIPKVPRYVLDSNLSYREQMRAKEEYLIAIEKYQLEVEQLKYDASKQRLKTMRKIIEKN